MSFFRGRGKIDAPERPDGEEVGPDDPRSAMGLAAVAIDPRWERPAPETFGEHARAHEPALRAVALRLCRSPSDAHDLVQDALERGLRNYDRLPPGSNVRAWLVSILRNRFIDSCRRGLREVNDDDGAAERLPAPEADEPEPTWARITSDELRAAVGKLREEFRLVYQLHALEGRSYQDIAEQLGIPKATVGTRLIRARRKLKALLLPHLAHEEEES
jgi:RNA polymerase sigma-70 factor (ECF subfamily)